MKRLPDGTRFFSWLAFTDTCDSVSCVKTVSSRSRARTILIQNPKFGNRPLSRAIEDRCQSALVLVFALEGPTYCSEGFGQRKDVGAD
jgi:hypothetical protein